MLLILVHIILHFLINKNFNYNIIFYYYIINVIFDILIIVDYTNIIINNN